MMNEYAQFVLDKIAIYRITNRLTYDFQRAYEVIRFEQKYLHRSITPTYSQAIPERLVSNWFLAVSWPWHRKPNQLSRTSMWCFVVIEVIKLNCTHLTAPCSKLVEKFVNHHWTDTFIGWREQCRRFWCNNCSLRTAKLPATSTSAT